MAAKEFSDILLDMAIEFDRMRCGLPVREETLQNFCRALGEAYPDVVGDEEPVIDVLKQGGYLMMLELDGETDMESLKNVADVAASVKALRGRLSVFGDHAKVSAMTPEEREKAKGFLIGMHRWEQSELMRGVPKRFMQEPEAVRA